MRLTEASSAVAALMPILRLDNVLVVIDDLEAALCSVRGPAGIIVALGQPLS